MAKRAKLALKLIRVTGETWGGSGKPMYKLEEKKGSRLIRRFTGTHEEMADLKRRMAADLRERARITAMLERGRRNPGLIIKPGKWIKASAVRVRKVAGRVVMDIKKAI